MRVTTAFNTMLAISGAWVTGVENTPSGIEVTLRLRRHRLECPECSWSTRSVHDRSTRRWRHLDLAGSRLFLSATIRRLHCRTCHKVVTEAVPWARPGSWHTRDFENVVAWLAQRVDKTTITRFLRCSWEAVTGIVVRVVTDHVDDARLDNLTRIGVDEICYRTPNQYLTVVADHDNDGAVVWAGEGKKAATLGIFYTILGPSRCQKLQAVSLDMGHAFAKATRDHAPQAAQCVDPFHVIKLANDALDTTRRWAWNNERKRRDPDGARRPRRATDQGSAAQRIKHTRWALLKDPAKLKPSQRDTLDALRRSRHVLYRAYEIKEDLRDMYKLTDPTDAADHLDRWLARTCRSRIPAMIQLSRTIRTNHDRILAAITLGLSNSRLEGINSRIRLINHRGYGHHTADALICMIYLCAGGITITLPTK